MSRAMATTILRKFSAWRSSFDVKLIFESLVTPSTSSATSAPNSLLDVVGRRERVLDDVVEEAGADARRVEPQVGDDAGDAHGVDDVRLTRLSGLPCVHPEAVVVGPLDQVGVDRRLVGPDAIDELFCLKHRLRPHARRRGASKK